MKSPELAEPIDSSSPETEETSVSESKELHEGGDIQKLWKKYHWMGEPPRAGSPVEERLRETCRRYMKHVLGESTSPELSVIKKGGDSEDYFAQFRKKEKDSSGASRRELHNQIALMVVGRQRSGMDTDLALKIAEFASEVAFNLSTAKALEATERGEL